MLAQLIILSLGITKCFSSPVKGVLSAAELDYKDSIIIQPIRNEDIPPQLCVLSFPFDATSGGKIFKKYSTIVLCLLLSCCCSTSTSTSISQFSFLLIGKIACEIF